VKPAGGQLCWGRPDNAPALLPVPSAHPDKLTQEERDRLWAESKDDDDFTDKAIAFGKLTGDFTIDRHILPQPTLDEIYAGAARIEAEHPERFLTEKN